MTDCTSHMEEAAPIQDAASILEQVFPGLLAFSRSELMREGLNPNDAEEATQYAAYHWCEVTGDEMKAYAYMRRAVKNWIIDRKRHPDPIPLEEFT